MSTENHTDLEVSEDEKSSAPAFTIDFCVSMIKVVISQRGETTFSRKDAAVILGKSESNISPKLGSCRQYGLIINDRGKGYRISPLYNKIELPTSIEEKNGALLTAMNNPHVYKRIIEDYNGKVLPANEEMFSNLLVTSYGMIKTSSERASKIFNENAKSLGIIDSNNRLRFIMPVAGNNTPIENHPKDENKNKDEKDASNKNDPPKPKEGLHRLPIVLDEEKTAYLDYPIKMTKDDIEVLKIMVNAAITTMELRMKKESKNPTDGGA